MTLTEVPAAEQEQRPDASSAASVPASAPTASVLVQPGAPGYTTVELDPTDDADKAAMIDVDEWAFSFVYPTEALENTHFVPEKGRTVGVRHERDGLVAVHASYEADLRVPGGAVPAAGLTWVGVHPGHRRRGLATAMLTTHLQRTAERGEPVSALFAAEPEIYGRYGYGLAARSVDVQLGRGVALRDVPGTEGLTCSLERASEDRHLALVADLLDRAARPGELFPRRDAHLRNYFAEVPDWREGAELRRIAVVRDADGDPRAFCLFRRKESWGPTGPEGTVRAGLWAAVDGAANRALWGTLTDLDLMGTVRLGGLAVDAPLLGQLVNLRSAKLRTADNVWVRIVDLPAALSARAYAAPVDVVLEVTDTVLPANAGRWRVEGGPSGARVTRLADGDPTPSGLALDVAELGAAYLGGIGLASLVAAGLVREVTPGAGAAAAAAFGWPLAPVCMADF
ncbi:GNAT family N-acetyltransferase [Miniimonas arenae]|uniref:GNAT family N-acetyltransferase n=1 Tax=Miniimonas arenae TaxID=676201 RepID=A0A5C5BC43_9MICO|nr:MULTISPECIES: GNAT family N-acetyltransferase [Miniimonas]TNU74078.1 GNAT family N-acetyltransferase [Miniimonas arenae]